MTSPIYTIYRATCTVNGKMYIGFDSAYPKRRKDHIRDALKNKRECLFHRAIRKYGVESFSWDILYQSPDLSHTLNEMESFFIREYRTFGDNGYNMTLGGEGVLGHKFTEEQRQQMSNSHVGVPLSEEHRQSISTAHKGKPKTQEHCINVSRAKKGAKFTDAHKQALSEAKLGKLANRRHPITIDGVEYSSKMAAAKHLNISWRQVENILNGKITYKTLII